MSHVLDTAWRFSFFGVPAGFAHPLLLGLILVGLAVGFFGLWAALARKKRLARVVGSRFVDRLAPGVSVLRPAISSGLYALGLMLFAIALAEPQCGGKTELIKRRGIDLVVALDASKSMLARDVSPNRLDRAKLELTALLDELKGDRVGIVVFAGDAFIQCPLTSDYAAAKMFLRAVDPDQMQEGGTNIGGALDLSRQMLDSTDRGAKDRVIVLLSDGEDLAGEVKKGEDALQDDNIKVLAVGIGSETGEPIPVVDRRGNVVGYKKDADGQTVLTRLDRSGLEALAQATGGEFFYQPNGVAMGEVAEKIDHMKKADLESRLAVRYDERFVYFAAPGFVFLLLGMFWPLSKRRFAT